MMKAKCRSRIHRRQRILVAILLVGFIVVGCGGKSTPVVYYTLSPLSYQSPAREPVQALVYVVLGVGPIHLPDYLDRPQIVSRVGPNRLRVNDFQRWGAPLEKDMTRVLGENIKQLTGIAYCLVHPWRLNPGPDVTLELDVHSFEALPDGQMILNATMALHDRRISKSRRYFRTFHIALPFTAVDDYAAVVAAQNQVVDELSRQIADSIIDLIK